ncbi:MAG: YdcF family protein [Epulopiscium sp.]|nr:YdcF family protein [Candidatus Epulonipiscium sp.]
MTTIFKKIRSFFIFLFSLFLLSFLLVEGLILYEGNKFENIEVDYVLVLGARLYGDVPSLSLVERLKTAYNYLDEHKNAKVVVSGGQGPGEDITEAEAMKRDLVDRGIDPNRIIKEDTSTNTFENLQFSLTKIQEVDTVSVTEIAIVSNDFHLFRAKMLAKRAGVQPYGLPAKTPPMSMVKSYLREYLAVFKSWIFDW